MNNLGPAISADELPIEELSQSDQQEKGSEPTEIDLKVQKLGLVLHPVEKERSPEISPSEVTIGVNKEAIQKLIAEAEVRKEKTENIDLSKMKRWERESIEIAKRNAVRELALLERFKELPDSVTLSSATDTEVFGENGSGKSILVNLIGKTMEAEIDIKWEARFARQNNEEPQFSDISGWVDYKLNSSSGDADEFLNDFFVRLLRAGVISTDNSIGKNSVVKVLDVQELLGRELASSAERAMAEYREEALRNAENVRLGRAQDNNRGRFNIEQRKTSSRQFIEDRIDALLENGFQSEATETELNPGERNIKVLILDEPGFGKSPDEPLAWFDNLKLRCREKNIILVMASNDQFLYDTKNTTSQRIDMPTIEGDKVAELEFEALLAQLPPVELSEAQKRGDILFDLNTDEIDELIAELESNKPVFEDNIDPQKTRELIDMLTNFKRLGKTVTIDEKKINLIFGRNASGKSTLAKMFHLAMLPKNGQTASDRISTDSSIGYGYSIAATLVDRNIVTLRPEQDINYVVYLDPLTRIGEGASIVSREMLDPGGRKEFMRDYAEGGTIAQQESTRQAINQEIVDKAKELKPGDVVIIDEADGGTSPQNHDKFNRLLAALTARGLIVIVPTNSYDSKTVDRGENRIYLTGNK